MANGARLLSTMNARHIYYNMQQQNSHRAVALVKLPTMHYPITEGDNELSILRASLAL